MLPIIIARLQANYQVLTTELAGLLTMTDTGPEFQDNDQLEADALLKEWGITPRDSEGYQTNAARLAQLEAIAKFHANRKA